MHKLTVQEPGFQVYGDGAVTAESVLDRRWYAVFTVPQNEKSAGPDPRHSFIGSAPAAHIGRIVRLDFDLERLGS